MPFVSRAQERWGHTEAGEKALGGPAAVAEWDAETKGKKLPQKVKTMRKRGLISPKQHAKLADKYGGEDQQPIDASSR